jgi:hypothetical protein
MDAGWPRIGAIAPSPGNLAERGEGRDWGWNRG